MLDQSGGSRIPIVTVNHVTHGFGERMALNDVTFTLEDGVTALVGVNGAGKSTLLRVMAGALRPDRGRLALQGLDLYGLHDRKRALPRIALMPQTVSFPRNMTALEVVKYIGWVRGLSNREAARRTDVVLAEVGLTHRAHERIGKLSGGMVRRVALAQALVAQPDVLLLDEPSTGLDPEQRRAMVALIQELGSTVLFSSHVVEDIDDVASRIIVLDEGEVLFAGALSELKREGVPHGASEGVEQGFMQLVTRRRERR